MAPIISRARRAIFSLSVFLIFLPPAIALANPPKIVYRVDGRPPSDIFRHGFAAYGENDDILAHMWGESTQIDSAFVATTEDYEAYLTIVANMLTGRNPPVIYGYTIRATDNFYSVMASANEYAATPNDDASPISSDDIVMINEHAMEKEWVAQYFIPPEQVWTVVKFTMENGEIRMSDEEENPIYDRQNTQASNIVLPFRGITTTPAPVLTSLFTLSPNRSNGTYFGVQYCSQRRQYRSTVSSDPCDNPYEIPVREFIAAKASRFYLE